MAVGGARGTTLERASCRHAPSRTFEQPLRDRPLRARTALEGSPAAGAGRLTSATSSYHDATAPTVSLTAERGTDHNGWYNHAVAWTPAQTDATSGADSCQAAVVYSGPDSATASMTRTCTDLAGNAGSASVSFKYDATNPTVSLTPDRATDHNGWYDQAVTWTPSQTDATSGADSCQAAVAYSGPDSSSASVTASCTDLAGNTGDGAVGFQYDGTKPVVNVTASRAADSGGWYDHPVSFSASTSSDATSLIDSCGTDVVYSGPDTSSGSQSFTCTDLAGNSSSSSIAFNYDATNPTSTITFPGSGPYNAAGWNDGCGTGAEKICGTAGDNLSGVAQVQVSIQQGSGNYWGGSSFNSAGENRITAAGNASWTLAFAAGNFPEGSYTVRVYVTDKAGNAQSSNSAQTFTIDTTPPTPALTRVNGDTVTFPFATSYPVTTIGGTCATATGDAATVNWSVSAGATDSGSTTCSSGSWTATLTTPLTTATGYTITVTQSDSAGNTGSTGSKSVTIDAPPA